MRFPGFTGPSYRLDSLNIEAQRCVNWYPKSIESGQGKSGERMALIATPGLSTLLTVGSGPIRGVYAASNGFLYAVSGNRVYFINFQWVALEIGELLTSTGQVDFADNGNTLFIVDGPNGYWHTFSSGIITRVTDTDWRGSDTVNFIDGYFLFSDPESGVFYISSLNGVEFDALDFSTADGSPDDIVATLVNHREVWLFGSESIEAWYNSGDPDFPFTRIGSGFIEMGCAAAFSVAKIDRSTFWIGKNKLGEGVVYVAQGLNPQRISTHAVELAIQSYGDISDAVAWTYQENGHNFYVLNFSSANTSWVYDLSTGLWHERAFLDGCDFKRHRANSHAYAYNTHVVGDFENGKIYSLDSNARDDAGDEIKRLRALPHLSQDMKRITYYKFQLEMETGTGLTGVTQGDDPEIILQFSDDGGHTWSNEKWAKIGKIGVKRQRVIWRKLGSSRDRIFRITMSDPVKANLIGAELELEGLGH
jgi:hypothetical protein